MLQFTCQYNWSEALGSVCPIYQSYKFLTFILRSYCVLVDLLHITSTRLLITLLLFYTYSSWSWLILSGSWHHNGSKQNFKCLSCWVVSCRLDTGSEETTIKKMQPSDQIVGRPLSHFLTQWWMKIQPIVVVGSIRKQAKQASKSTPPRPLHQLLSPGCILFGCLPTLF